jgi:hypothetical protein
MATEVVSLVAGLVSVILGIIAIGISVYFYTQAKDTEREVSGALEGIRAQTDALQKIVGRQMGQLIRGVTEQQPHDFTLVQQMIGAIKDIPISVITLLQTPPPSTQANQAWRAETIKGYLGAFYYSAITNLCNQYFLPPLEQLQPDDLFKRMVDGSYQDFRMMDNWFTTLDQVELQNSPSYHLYCETLEKYKAFVKDSTTVYAERAANSQNT